MVKWSFQGGLYDTKISVLLTMLFGSVAVEYLHFWVKGQYVEGEGFVDLEGSDDG